VRPSGEHVGFACDKNDLSRRLDRWMKEEPSLRTGRCQHLGGAVLAPRSVAEQADKAAALVAYGNSEAITIDADLERSYRARAPRSIPSKTLEEQWLSFESTTTATDQTTGGWRRMQD
jgi:hypothetical protein